MDIKLQQVGFSYAAGTPFEKRALYEVDFKIPTGTYQAIIGHTGSGKSTVLQHFNALLKPTVGEVAIGEFNIKASEKKPKNIKEMRQHVGIVFQFPEHQLFEETVLKDIMFGPINFGVGEDEAKRRAEQLIEQVGLPTSILNKSPFDLSGGQMRRVAIAGVLAMKPDVIVLDEPTAGLDPKGQKEMMDMFYRLHKEEGLTTILVTHSMEDAARYADDIIIMHDGTNVLQGEPRQIFADHLALKKYRLEPPRIVRFQEKVEQLLGKALPKVCLTEEELAQTIADVLKERAGIDG
ncbi:energy-coupling factor transporter ATP-binding protein EcfA2 [Lysinibacillus alkalisoli]|uniref:Energy-coupling factor transporter ATP-binding protein EcfA2 n=1 Tax=Lysinibacillus alkalisoli TaxID=1911548 RepID=A0A917G8U7_9BACI|nr:energy-coupling factor ABC transporter ATP-binding protein [Lysinibacillus alkalisoli]GGG29392.1 energy-coupling factor transporter ATP-binding protein EcfA2 [Lysinibacillus alkalisoli]